MKKTLPVALSKRGTNDVKLNLLDHSEAKVQLLGQYIKRYLHIISNDGYTQSINIYDLFCGPGLYENGGHGSPLVTLKHIKEAYYNLIQHKSDKLPKINCHFNDIDSEKIDQLTAAIRNNSYHYPHIGQLVLTCSDYKAEVSKLIAKFKQFGSDKAFVFIDPYGYKELIPEDVKGLLGSNKKSEILIWLPIQFMYRFADEGRPPVLENFIRDLNIDKEVKSSKNVWDFITCLKNGFQSYLGTDFFVDNFSLKKDENTVFCLFFFTSHIKGFEKMLESKWEIDSEQGRGWEYNTSGPSLFYEQKTNDLELFLTEFMKSGKRTNYDVYEFVLRKSYLTKHATEILCNLQKNGKLDVFEKNGTKARKNSFYIKYCRPNDVENKMKVYFVIK